VSVCVRVCVCVKTEGIRPKENVPRRERITNALQETEERNLKKSKKNKSVNKEEETGLEMFFLFFFFFFFCLLCSTMQLLP